MLVDSILNALRIPNMLYRLKKYLGDLRETKKADVVGKKKEKKRIKESILSKRTSGGIIYFL